MGPPFSVRCSDLMVRTVWQLEHMMTVSVWIPSGCTSMPLRKRPPVTAVAENSTPSCARSAVVSGASTSSRPAALTWSTWWRGHRPEASPHLSADAAQGGRSQDPLYGPPDADGHVHAALPEGGCDAGRDVPVGDELEPGPRGPDLRGQVPRAAAGRAPPPRAPKGGVPRALATPRMLSPTEASMSTAAAARPATITFCMYISGTSIRLPRGPAAIIASAPSAPLRQRVGGLERLDDGVPERGLLSRALLDLVRDARPVHRSDLPARPRPARRPARARYPGCRRS